MNSILVVCVGNICRSPMAEALLAAALPDRTVSSAGTGALVGEAADPMAQALMAERGLDLGAHRARQISQALCQAADLILTMDDDQRRYVEARYPLQRGRVFRLCGAAKADVPDPYRQDRSAFEQALQLIDDGVATWVDRIQKF